MAGDGMTHFREEYECGHVGAQCRCPAPNKRVTKLIGKCPACRKAQGEAGYTEVPVTPSTTVPITTPLGPLPGEPTPPPRHLQFPASAGRVLHVSNDDLPPVAIEFTSRTGTRLSARMSLEDYRAFRDTIVRTTPAP